MQKKTIFILFVLFISLLSACSANEKENNANEGDSTNEQEKQETEEQSLNVDKGLLNVDVTLPASFFVGQDMDTVIADIEKDGV